MIRFRSIFCGAIVAAIIWTISAIHLSDFSTSDYFESDIVDPGGWSKSRDVALQVRTTEIPSTRAATALAHVTTRKRPPSLKRPRPFLLAPDDCLLRTTMVDSDLPAQRDTHRLAGPLLAHLTERNSSNGTQGFALGTVEYPWWNVWGATVSVAQFPSVAAEAATPIVWWPASSVGGAVSSSNSSLYVTASLNFSILPATGDTAGKVYQTCTRSSQATVDFVQNKFCWPDRTVRRLAEVAVGLRPPSTGTLPQIGTTPSIYSQLPQPSTHAMESVSPNLTAECVAAWYAVSVSDLVADPTTLPGRSGRHRRQPRQAAAPFGALAQCAGDHRSLAPALYQAPPHAAAARALCTLYGVANLTARLQAAFSEAQCVRQARRSRRAAIRGVAGAVSTAALDKESEDNPAVVVNLQQHGSAAQVAASPMSLSSDFFRIPDTHSIDRSHRTITRSVSPMLASSECARLCLNARNSGRKVAEGSRSLDAPTDFVCTHFTIRTHAVAAPGHQMSNVTQQQLAVCTLHGGVLNLVPNVGATTYIPTWVGQTPATPPPSPVMPSTQPPPAPPLSRPGSATAAGANDKWLRSVGVNPRTGQHLVAFGVLSGGEHLRTRLAPSLQMWARNEPAVALFIERLRPAVDGVAAMYAAYEGPLAARIAATRRDPSGVYPHFRVLDQNDGESGAAYSSPAYSHNSTDIRQASDRFDVGAHYDGCESGIVALGEEVASFDRLPLPNRPRTNPFNLTVAQEDRYRYPLPNPFGGLGTAAFRFIAEPTDARIRAFNGAWKNFRIARDLPRIYPIAHWYMIVDDDTYVLSRNLRYTLALASAARLHVNTWAYAGYVERGHGYWFVHGGSGIILSRALMLGSGVDGGGDDGAKVGSDGTDGNGGYFFTPQRLSACEAECTMPYGDVRLACCLGTDVGPLPLHSLSPRAAEIVSTSRAHFLLTTHRARTNARLAFLHKQVNAAARRARHKLIEVKQQMEAVAAAKNVSSSAADVGAHLPPADALFAFVLLPTAAVLSTTD